MRTFEIAVPDELASALEPYQDRMAELVLLGYQQLKIREALLLYGRGLVSFARAAELAGIPREEMTRQARAAGFSPRWAETHAESALDSSQERAGLRRN
jgi:hypothetical protein